MRTPARLLALVLIVGSASAVQADDDKFAARLSGYNEVHFIAGADARAARRRLDAGPGVVRGPDRRPQGHHPLRAAPTRG